MLIAMLFGCLPKVVAEVLYADNFNRGTNSATLATTSTGGESWVDTPTEGQTPNQPLVSAIEDDTLKLDGEKGKGYVYVDYAMDGVSDYTVDVDLRVTEYGNAYNANYMLFAPVGNADMTSSGYRFKKSGSGTVDVLWDNGGGGNAATIAAGLFNVNEEVHLKATVSGSASTLVITRGSETLLVDSARVNNTTSGVLVGMSTGWSIASYLDNLVVKKIDFLYADNFDHGNGVTTLPPTSTGGESWVETVTAGNQDWTFWINNNRLKMNAMLGTGYVYVDYAMDSVSDYTVDVDLQVTEEGSAYEPNFMLFAPVGNTNMTSSGYGFRKSGSGTIDVLWHNGMGTPATIASDLFNTNDVVHLKATVSGSASTLVITRGLETLFEDSARENNTTTGKVVGMSTGWAIVSYLDNLSVKPIAAAPFPEIPDSLGPNLIPNGEFDTVANEVPSAGLGLYNVTNTFGDYFGATGRTATVVDWSPYFSDPNSVTPSVGTPHVIDGNGELDSTFYVDTHVSSGDIVLNSVMDYRNGMKTEDILDGVSIDSGKTYRFTVDAVGWDRPAATFMAALTDGSGTAVTNPVNAIESLSGSVDSWDGALTVDVDGADLLAAGQVNVIFDHVNPVAIPGFPGSVAPTDVSKGSLVSQVRIHSVSLTELLSAGLGDVNKDGLVNDADVTLAQTYLDGAGGEPATNRQAILILEGLSPEQALAFLNLTDFDIDGDGYFDAVDVGLIDALVPNLPVQLEMTLNGAMADFQWNSNGGQLYDLESATALSNPDWQPYDGHTNMASSGTGSNTLNDVDLDGSSARFFRMIEK